MSTYVCKTCGKEMIVRRNEYHTCFSKRKYLDHIQVYKLKKEGLTFKEIAERLGSTGSSVGHAYLRAKRRMHAE